MLFRSFQVDANNELTPPVNPNSFNLQYLVDIASESIYNYKKDPSKAQFYSVTSGINAKAVLGAGPLDSDTAKIMANGSLVQMVNGSLVQMVNGTTGPMVPILNGSLVQIVNGELSPVSNGSLVQLVNGSLVQLVNSEFVALPNGSLVQFVNGSLVQLVNGSLVQLVNGQQVPIINGANVTDISTIPNGSLVQMVNGSLVQMVNGSLVQLVNGSLVQLVNGSLVQLVNGSLVQLVNGNTLGIGSASNNTAVILDAADVDFQSNWIGPMFGINMVTGLDVGLQSIIPGVLVNSNFDITYGLGKLTVNSNPCLITHSPFKVFGNTSNPGAATSLWMSLTTKVSGQLRTKGDFLLFKSGSITFTNIKSSPLIKDFALPAGKIIADNVTVPFTVFDSVKNLWITKVPLGFSSTSDLFVTGAIINSSNGFTKDSSNTSSVVKGIFYSNKNFGDQWTYAMAAYQPQFFYASITDSGKVTSTNGTYRTATPTTQLQNLVNGASGGGGNNYTGSSSSFDKFTACLLSSSAAFSQQRVLNEEEDVQNNTTETGLQVAPNPATNYLTLSFVTTHTGNSAIALYSMDGKKVLKVENGISEAGKKYYKKLDISKLSGGLYLVQLRSADKIIIKKIIINR